MLIAIVILIVSMVMLLQFFVSYCRSLIAESRGCELSVQTRELAGVTGWALREDQFKRLLRLVALCPEPGGDGHQLQAVTIYFSMLGSVRKILSWAISGAEQWIESERGGCSYVAAVALDRRIAFNRMLKARQISLHL